MLRASRAGALGLIIPARASRRAPSTSARRCAGTTGSSPTGAPRAPWEVAPPGRARRRGSRSRGSGTGRGVAGLVALAVALATAALAAVAAALGARLRLGAQLECLARRRVVAAAVVAVVALAVGMARLAGREADAEALQAARAVAPAARGPAALGATGSEGGWQRVEERRRAAAQPRLGRRRLRRERRRWRSRHLRPRLLQLWRGSAPLAQRRRPGWPHL